MLQATRIVRLVASVSVLLAFFASSALADYETTPAPPSHRPIIKVAQGITHKQVREISLALDAGDRGHFERLLRCKYRDFPDIACYTADREHYRLTILGIVFRGETTFRGWDYLRPAYNGRGYWEYGWGPTRASIRIKDAGRYFVLSN